jgi:hypothetical protein
MAQSGACAGLYYYRPYPREINKERTMIKVGDKLPAGKLWELPVEWFAGCPTAADEIAMPLATQGKRIVLFGIPGAFTRT